MNEQRIITRPELNKMAKEREMKGYLKLKRFELAERLGIEIPKPRRKEERKPRKHAGLKSSIQTERRRCISRH